MYLDIMNFRQNWVRIVHVLTLTALFAAVLAAASPQLDTASKLYHSTAYERSLQVLATLPQNDPAVQALIGRNYYMLGDFKKATNALSKAADAEPNNSEYVLWLGRAFGRRAETSSVFTAPGYASKTRQYFERAVALDPKNIEAANDLLEFYLEAPGFLGGGYQKAEAVAAKIYAVDPVEGTWAQGKIAEKRKEYRAAEEHLRQAAQLAPQQIGRLIDLARFLFRQGRYDEAEQSFDKAAKIAPNNAKLLFERAEAYIQAKRNMDTARELLERYLRAPLTVDDPPRSDAEKLLRKVQGG